MSKAENTISRRSMFPVIAGGLTAGTFRSAGAVAKAVVADAAIGPDARLIAAEREAVALFAWLGQCREESPRVDALYEQAFGLDRFIADTAPLSFAGAAVKLRRVLDPELGLPAGDHDADIPSLQQVLAFVEQCAAGAV